MKRAKSRLKQPAFEKPAGKHSNPSQPIFKAKDSRQKPTGLGAYLRYLPVLILSLPFYALVFWIVSTQYPDQIADTLFSNSYLYFQIPLFIANTLLFSFLLLDTTRGVLLSSLISILLFLRLQLVIFELSWILPLLGIFVLLDLITKKLIRPSA